ncbi:PIG-L family deacetylase [Gryllotalpicola kribbensis]|uniref:PIG-L family deacetylase n=1 Tax=Gryllotalpicola kribbensis TaxID=993084 RepID=A0ABP8AT71_9MICO
MALPPLFARVRRALFLHAHPDDESLSTGGLIAALGDAGAAVRVVTCTRGERGEVVPGPLSWLEGTPELADHRVGELTRALYELGAGTPCFLGEPRARALYRGPDFRYLDSGMSWGEDGRAQPAPDAPAGTFAGSPAARADAIAAAKRFRPDVVVSYDSGGGYGHPDHRWAHEVARDAAAAVGVPFIEVVPAEASDAVDVAIDLAAKRRALAAHASQLTLTADGFVLSGGQHHVLEPVERYRLSPAPAARPTTPRGVPWPPQRRAAPRRGAAP